MYSLHSQIILNRIIINSNTLTSPFFYTSTILYKNINIPFLLHLQYYIKTLTSPFFYISTILYKNIDKEKE